MDLRKRVGTLVAAHRRRLSMTQQQLADRIGMSADMVSRIETGGTGLRFPTIQKIADALDVDPGELFVVSMTSDVRKPLNDLTVRLSALPDRDLLWIGELLTVALKGRK